MIRNFSERPIDLYNYILSYYATHERMPSVREMVHDTDYKSTSSIGYALTVLTDWRWIHHDFKKARAITLTRITERGLSPQQLRNLLTK